ncbi:hypothetical protein MESS2_1370061 [Mesorhizobium metallidurans STM 2683]|uniref:Uncharacterized protein n=1 Tax=Mesorhizobium metallidurans STM 2683 TaxID=1297569 RepID=M5EJ85_9HYPH|nr:hypothetical protein MESS2_1370061 [Mesorhizobium metallidurans STM 2683]
MAECGMAQPGKPEELGLRPFDRHDPRHFWWPHVSADARRARSRDEAVVEEALNIVQNPVLGRRVTNAYVGTKMSCNARMTRASGSERIMRKFNVLQRPLRVQRTRGAVVTSRQGRGDSSWTPTPIPSPAQTPNGAPG